LTSATTVKAWLEKHPDVEAWIKGKFTDEATATNYAYNLMVLSRDLKVEPKKFMSIMDGGPLFKRVKQHLEGMSRTNSRKAGNMKYALQGYLNYHSERPDRFRLNLDLEVKQKWERPAWGLPEYEKVFSYLTPKYRPLFRLQVMTGLGGKEAVYLNKHFDKVVPVPDVSGAMMLPNIPSRKKGTDKWTAVLPEPEFLEFKNTAPLKTFRGNMVSVLDLTSTFRRATDRAGLRIVGTNQHIGRSIFTTVAKSKPEPNVDNEYIELNLGHMDKMHYDRSQSSLPKIQERARELQKYWEYVRRGGPSTATGEDLKQRDEMIEELRREQEKMRTQINFLNAVTRTAGIKVGFGPRDHSSVELQEVPPPRPVAVTRQTSSRRRSRTRKKHGSRKGSRKMR